MLVVLVLLSKMLSKEALLLIGIACFATYFSQSFGAYQPTWESLDSRPLPPWYDEAKVGIFIHWGVFSVPSFGSEWFWFDWLGRKEQMYIDFMKNNYPPRFSYQEFASQFTAEFFEPNDWADLFAASGAKYVVFTTKHHEGFCNWKTELSWNWNSVDIGPHRDLVGDIAKAIRSRTKLHFGLYHSLFEWFNPLYLQDAESGYKTQLFVKEKTMPELYELVNTYEPEIIWSDGNKGYDTYFNSTNFLAWLYNESPVKDVVVTNDRWGWGLECKHGGFYTCTDRYNPGVLQKHKWENCMTLDKYSWGYRRNANLSDYMTIEELIQTLAETVSCGGNLLVNVGPTSDGVITPIYEEILRNLGSWLGVNGEAIYGSKPWRCQNDTVTSGVWYTSQKTATGTSVYAMVLAWPKGSMLTLGCPTTNPQTTVSLLGYKQPIKWSSKPGGGMIITLPTLSIRELPCLWAWTLRIDNLS